ncbi:MAG: 50S ribosomal protein L23 [Gammaproteobacteria bacterium RIFCSPHIGHO2_12_FULL_41_20]|nr:MAG: 50S ribosomal protein L23 [Gammaproteobacteria bacterium RIFCSPHIGHO2_12_FULL_41_20]
MNQERFFQIIYSPYTSEKAATGAEKRREYAFKVAPDAKKPEIKGAIEFLFNTKVESVTVVTVKQKIKAFRGRVGRKKGWKKAYVTLCADQKLDFSVIQ